MARMSSTIGITALALLLAVAVIGRMGRAALLQQQLYIVPQANVLTGTGQRPTSPEQPAGEGGSSKAAHTEQLYIVPQANVLIGAGQRPVAKAAVKQALLGKGIGKKTPISTPPLAPKWTAAQRLVHDRVAREMAEERERREEKAHKEAKGVYVKTRKAMLAHEERRQVRLRHAPVPTLGRGIDAECLATASLPCAVPCGAVNVQTVLHATARRRCLITRRFLVCWKATSHRLGWLTRGIISAPPAHTPCPLHPSCGSPPAFAPPYALHCRRASVSS